MIDFFSEGREKENCVIGYFLVDFMGESIV